VALEMKYKPMLNLATLKSRLFNESIKDMYRVVFASDLLNGIDRETWQFLDINYQYDLPHDSLTEAQTAQALSSLGISTETWLKVLSVVNDPRQEKENMDKEKQDQMASNLDFLKQNNAVTDGDSNDNSQGRETKD
ncbi:phage portal protein, partial [Lactobacillus salivarius]|nr:phage portal protein [Ligilactobacillus salivarius]